MQSNFTHIAVHDKELFRLSSNAERYFPDDPNTSLIKLRQFGELLAQQVASRFGLYTSAEETQLELLRRLESNGDLEREVASLFHNLRQAGNAATHSLRGDHSTALNNLKIAWQLSLWFHRSFGEPEYRSGPFQPPQPPELQRSDDDDLRKALEALKLNYDQAQAKESALTQTLNAQARQLSESLNLQKEWENLAEESEAEKARLVEKLQALQAEASQQAATTKSDLKRAAKKASGLIQLDEPATRKLIDAQLRDAGWECDTKELRFSKGARPEAHRNKAIAEWPTESGPADYVLFLGLTPIAAVEAKRANKDVAGVLPQAERYCETYVPDDQGIAAATGDMGGPFPIPFAFSSNGRPYLPQLKTKSGIWFRDTRKDTNLSRPLDGWYTPEGLKQLARQDSQQAHAQLKRETFNYGFPLRPYQRQAIESTEAAIEAGKQQVLLAMATGTGKTKTCIALIYRLLKTNRFRRVLFLVDRSELGKQAADAFKETRMESLQHFADIYGIKELGEKEVESDTRVHIATVQAMVQRLMLGNDDEKPSVDTYDLIVVDECHRGYLLDRELSERELGFRDFNDYVSKYRRVIEYFDAVKVGLTATPALHTKEIFGYPIFVYSYREAVVDGFLVDHEPPTLIKTVLSSDGIHFAAGDEVKVFDPSSAGVDRFNTPDALDFEVESFNRKVITEPFNRAVCQFLATELDPQSPQKTLIFCANNDHADLVVTLLKEALEEQYGSIANDAVMKITGKSDRPDKLIRRYRNEAFPNIAVTVDLLSTGVDVPAICNIVFLRRMNSRILYDQMRGRATRLCEAINKTHFRIFDAVGIYEALKDFSDMKPVVADPKISISQLLEEFSQEQEPSTLELIRDQLVAKVRRKVRSLSDEQSDQVQQVTGEQPLDFVGRLLSLPVEEASRWVHRMPRLAEVLDAPTGHGGTPQVISDHPDQLRSTEHGYGKGQKPEDYLEAFTAFIKQGGNELPALNLVLQKPWGLTRADLKSLRIALDAEGYNEASLRTAWRDTTNQELVASIMGHIRRAAFGDALVPYAERVDKALQRILASRSWTGPQREWLQRIASQTKSITIVDRAAIDDQGLVFRKEGGGWPRLNKMFNEELGEVLELFQREVWAA
ncbi:type I restriction-modification system endonuclease [Synechococcus sp. MIT S9452]|uniref:type I restriction-modification system endonuclease n=1 Tax=Synechococcus sp. MIT S9452 TaxID=3082546 RepID=UPI0039A429AA